MIENHVMKNFVELETRNSRTVTKIVANKFVSTVRVSLPVTAAVFLSATSFVEIRFKSFSRIGVLFEIQPKSHFSRGLRRIAYFE